MVFLSVGCIYLDIRNKCIIGISHPCAAKYKISTICQRWNLVPHRCDLISVTDNFQEIFGNLI